MFVLLPVVTAVTQEWQSGSKCSGLHLAGNRRFLVQSWCLLNGQNLPHLC